MSALRQFCSAVALATVCAGPVAAFDTDPKPGLIDFLSIDRIGTLLANTAIAGLRSQMELEYAVLSTDITRGSIAISGVVAHPLLPYDQARQCVVTVDRAVIATDITQPFEVASEVSLNLIGARVSAACLPGDVAMGLRTAGLSEIALDQLKIRVAYVYATGETSADATLAVNDLAVFDFSASGMILPRVGDFVPADPAFRVIRAVASLKDRGGWQRAKQILPPNLTAPETIRQIGTEALTRALSAEGTRALTAVERNFVTGLMARVADYVRDPGEITIEADLPPTGIVIEPETYNNEPEALVAALALTARVAPLARARIVGAADLALVSDPSAADPAQVLRLAEALLEGDGVPRSPVLVPALLEPLLADPAHTADAAALAARALQDRDPKAAYGYALRAAAGGIAAAVPVLDRLETRMTSIEVLAAQTDFLHGSGPQPTLPASNDPRDLRRLALAHLLGSGAPRSYETAYYFALLAEAAGDIGAGTLRKEIDRRFDARGQNVRDDWDARRTGIEARALRDWVASGLAERYARQ